MNYNKKPRAFISSQFGPFYQVVVYNLSPTHRGGVRKDGAMKEGGHCQSVFYVLRGALMSPF